MKASGKQPTSLGADAEPIEVPIDESVEALWMPQTRERAITLKLTVIARHLRQRFDQTVEHDGLTRAKWRVIVAAARSAGTTQRAIAAKLEITEVTAGHLIDRLCADGYLERREHPKDRRAYCIHLTPAAKPLLGRLEEVAKIHESEAFAGFDAEDLARLDQLLDSVSHNLAAFRSRHEDRKAHRKDDAAAVDRDRS
jgi:MarR family transcriptional regulator for hemolysin